MPDLTAAEQVRFAIDGVIPYRALRERLAAGVKVRVIQYPSPLKDRLHPDDDAKLRAAVRAAKEIQDIVRAGG